MKQKTKPTALILGSQPLAEHLVQCFQLHHIEAHTLRAPLPLLSDRGATGKLRAIFEDELKKRPFTLLHPGAQAWADRQELQILAEEFEFTLIAPPARVLSIFSNQLALLTEAEKEEVPTAALGLTPLHSEREIERALENASFPLVLKSSRGIAGSGICVIQSQEDLKTKIPLWLEQLRLHLGDVTVFPERYISEGRIINLPFARLHREKPVFFPCTEVSLQSRGRKLVQFCPAPSLDVGIEKKLQGYATRIAERTGFNGVGCFEFLVEGKRIYLLEGAARLNTSFRIWEMVAGTLALDWQLAALGLCETPEIKTTSDTAMSLRIFAEDPILQIPQPGHLFEISEARSWNTPQAKAEFHLCVEEGEDICLNSSGILGEFFVYGSLPKAVSALAQGVLEETWISGSLQTNQRFLYELIQHPWVKEGVFHAGFIDEEFLPVVRPHLENLRMIGAFAPLLDSPFEKYKIVVANKVISPPAVALNWVQGPIVFDGGIRGLLQLPDGTQQRVCAFRVVEDRWKVRFGLWEVILKRISPADTKIKKIASLAAGEIHSLLFRAGSVIPAHQPLLFVRSLGVLIPHALSHSVRVLKWKVASEERVQLGQELAEFELID